MSIYFIYLFLLYEFRTYISSYYAFTLVVWLLSPRILRYNAQNLRKHLFILIEKISYLTISLWFSVLKHSMIVSCITQFMHLIHKEQFPFLNYFHTTINTISVFITDTIEMSKKHIDTIRKWTFLINCISIRCGWSCVKYHTTWYMERDIRFFPTWRV